MPSEYQIVTSRNPDFVNTVVTNLIRVGYFMSTPLIVSVIPDEPTHVLYTVAMCRLEGEPKKPEPPEMEQKEN